MSNGKDLYRSTVNVSIVMKSTETNGSSSNGTKKEYKKTKQFLRKQERTKNDIIAAARELFSIESFHNVILKDISTKALVSRTTLFNYFKNKDDIFFAVSNQVYEEENERIFLIISSDLSGREQILELCKKAFNDRIERPILSKVIKEFWNRLNNHKLSSGEIYTKIANQVGGPDKLEELANDPSILANFNFEEHFSDEKYFIQLYLQFRRNGLLWEHAVSKGKKDGTIQNSLPDLQIVQYINILMDGIIAEMQLRQSALDRINMKRETFESYTLHLISVFLDKNI